MIASDTSLLWSLSLSGGSARLRTAMESLAGHPFGTSMFHVEHSDIAAAC
jgi:hypothetical protein